MVKSLDFMGPYIWLLPPYIQLRPRSVTAASGIHKQVCPCSSEPSSPQSGPGLDLASGLQVPALKCRSVVFKAALENKCLFRGPWVGRSLSVHGSALGWCLSSLL